jgi:hypothetical protein
MNVAKPLSYSCSSKGADGCFLMLTSDLFLLDVVCVTRRPIMVFVTFIQFFCNSKYFVYTDSGAGL